MRKSFETIELEWDSEYFGIPACKIVLLETIDKSDIEEIFNFIKDYEFVTIVNKNNDPENNVLLATIFKAFLTDINVVFSKKVENRQTLQECNYLIADEMPYAQEIVDIAEISFKYSRFYNDPYLPSEKARNIYKQWAMNSFRKKGKYFITIKDDRDKIAGFLLCNIEKEKSLCTIELIAVDENYKGKGYGSKLLKILERFVHNNGILNIVVGTQVNNIHAVNFYTKNGFKYIGCNSVYHLWPKIQMEKEG